MPIGLVMLLLLTLDNRQSKINNNKTEQMRGQNLLTTQFHSNIRIRNRIQVGKVGERVRSRPMKVGGDCLKYLKSPTPNELSFLVTYLMQSQANLINRLDRLTRESDVSSRQTTKDKGQTRLSHFRPHKTQIRLARSERSIDGLSLDCHCSV